MSIEQIPTAENAEHIRQQYIRAKAEHIAACILCVIVAEIGQAIGLANKVEERAKSSAAYQDALATAIVELKNI